MQNVTSQVGPGLQGDISVRLPRNYWLYRTGPPRNLVRTQAVVTGPTKLNRTEDTCRPRHKCTAATDKSMGPPDTEVWRLH